MFRKIVASVCAAMLAVALAPASALASPLGAHPTFPAAEDAVAGDSWFTEEALADLLAAGEYVDGEAIAVIDNTVGGLHMRSVNPLDSAEALMDVSASAYREATGETVANEEAVDQGASAYALSDDADAATDDAEGAQAVSIVLVRQGGVTTEELLRMLADDPRVVSAEPNYTIRVDEGGGAVSSAVDASAGLASTANASLVQESVPDLSSYQWASENSGETMTIMHDDTVTQRGFDIGQAEWNTGEVNAAGTVAVFDSGIDYTHPDLESVMWDGASLRDIAGEGGVYGINVSGDGSPDDIMDGLGHGTHCSGIIAAAWDGQGISGVANGAKLVGVKFLGDSGYGTYGGELKGYAYLSKIAQAVNLKAVNNSWGGVGGFTAMRLAVTELGEKGAVTVFATANDSHDNDELPATSSALANNPYAVTVNASDSAGLLSAYSNFGAYTTNLAAPGSSILSTVPTKVMTQYFPEAAASNPLAEAPVALETYQAGEAPCAVIQASDANGAAASIGQLESAIHYDAGSGAWRVPLSQMNKVEGEAIAALAGAAGTRTLSARSFDVKIQVNPNKLDEVRYFSLRCVNPNLRTGDPDRVYVSIAGVDAVSQSGDTALAANDGQQATKARARMVDGWAPATLDVEALLSEAGMKDIALDDQGNMTVHCVALLPYDFNAMPNDDTLVFDCFGAGSGKGALGSYDIYCGTSMAAPVASGAAAVLAKRYGEGTNDEIAQQGATALADATALRAARLRGSVSASAAFEGTCTTDGHLDLSIADVDRAPSIRSIEAGDDASTVAVSGYFFGEGAGALTLNGASAEIVSWEADRVVAKRPAGLQNGLVAIVLTAGNGASSRAKMSYSSPDAQPAASLYERVLPSPIEAEKFAERNVQICSLEACGDDLFLLGMDDGPVMKGLWSFDIADNAWSLCADIPVANPEEASFAPLGDYLYVAVSADENGEASQQIWRYDPAADSWSKQPIFVESAQMSFLAGYQGSLVLVGGIDGNGQPLGVRRYDPQSGIGDELIAFDEVRLWPQVEASGDALYVCQGFDLRFAFQSGTLMRIAPKGDGWSIEDMSGVMPEYENGNVFSASLALAGYDGGVAVVGLPSKGKDTALLANDAQELVAYPKALSTERVFLPAAVEKNGSLYALGITNYDQDRMVFRATFLGTDSDEPTSGNEPSISLDSPEPKPLAKTGDPLDIASLACILLGGACFAAAVRLQLRRR